MSQVVQALSVTIHKCSQKLAETFGGHMQVNVISKFIR